MSETDSSLDFAQDCEWESGELLPGSAIFVPRKIEKEDKTLPIIRDLATILASLAAITVALVQVTRR